MFSAHTQLKHAQWKRPGIDTINLIVPCPLQTGSDVWALGCIALLTSKILWADAPPPGSTPYACTICIPLYQVKQRGQCSWGSLHCETPLRKYCH